MGETMIHYESLYEGGPFHAKIRFVAEPAFTKGRIQMNGGAYELKGRLETGLYLWRWTTN
jgi:hypothetical protein